MVINNLHIRRTGRTLSPLEADPPLIINADAVLSFSVSPQRLKTVAGQDGKIPQSDRSLQTVKLEPRWAFKSREGFDPFTLREIASPLIAITEDH
jgi:hypothetical protein